MLSVAFTQGSFIVQCFQGLQGLRLAVPNALHCLGVCFTLRLSSGSGSSSSSGKPDSKQAEPKQASDAGASGGKPTALPANGYTLVSQALYRMGIRNMYGVVGIPVTELASAAQVGGSAHS